MKAIIQTGYAAENSVEIADIEENTFHPTSIEVETLVAPLLPYDIMKLSGRIQAKIPNVIGYGAVGRVSRVGHLRSGSLINQRVIVFNPNGTFKEKVVSNMPPLSVPIPDDVTSEEAAVVIGGFDTSYMLVKKLIRTDFKKIIILGANSVIGLGLIQLISIIGGVSIAPKVRDESKKYFDEFTESLEINAISKNVGDPEHTLVIDIAGQEQDVSEYVNKGFHVISVVLQDISGVQFVSEPIFPKDYSYLLKLISKKALKIPIDRTFPFEKIHQAITYQKKVYSRGRNLISFNVKGVK